MAAHLIRFGQAVLAAACSMPVVGLCQSLPDPTRLPSALGQGRVENAVAAPVADALALQSILISPQRRLAVIGGRTVAVGDAVGNARVLRIQETEVVLREGSETRILRMYPEVEKKSPVAAQALPANKNKQQ
ncbi:MAG TPA: MSHA biogenesis protein MshK [Noviherbaspirillum sp.]|nr:MSHA biogenesis protein MshK [Noviherbaspirillum sp.]